MEASWRGIRYRVLGDGSVEVLEPKRLHVPPPLGYSFCLACSVEGEVTVEELTVGTPVRIALVDERVVAFLDDGSVYGYASLRLHKSLDSLRALLSQLGAKDGVVYGLVAGAENPLNPFFQDHAKKLDIIVTAVYAGDKLVYGLEARRLAELAGLPVPRLLREKADGGTAYRLLAEAELKGYTGLGLRCLNKWCYVGIPGQKMVGELVHRLLALGHYVEASVLVLAAAARARLIGYNVPRIMAAVYDALQLAVEAFIEAAGKKPGVRIAAWLEKPERELGEALAKALTLFNGMLRSMEIMEEGDGVRVEAVVGTAPSPKDVLEALKPLLEKGLEMLAQGLVGYKV